MLCEWEVKLFIKPGLPKSENISGYHFEVDEHENTYVILKYTTNSFDEILPNRINNNEYAEQTLCREHTQKIEYLLLMRMIHNSLIEKINIVKERDPELKNREELQEKEVKLTRKISAYIEQPFGILNTSNTILEVIQFFNKYKNTKTNKELFIQIAKWLTKSEESQNQIERFTILWTSFNTIFNICSDVRNKTKENEIQKIKGAINLLITPILAEQLLKSEKENLYKLTSWKLISKKNTNYSNELQNCLYSKNIDHVLTLKITLLCIYVLRNQIFHDGPRTKEIEEKAKVGIDILKPFLANCLNQLSKN